MWKSHPEAQSSLFFVPQVHEEFRCCRTVPGIVIVAESENFQNFGIARQRLEYIQFLRAS